MNRNFFQLLMNQWNSRKFVCVGLDSEFGKIPKSAHVGGNECAVHEGNTIVAFNRAIVEATKDIVCAYKPNVAFYEAHGVEGMGALQRTIADIHTIAPGVPVILDAKRADIGNTNAGYVDAAFDFLGADAITVHPYLGAEALQPFLARADKGVIALCRTSNPGAGEFQDLRVEISIEEWKYLSSLGGIRHGFSADGGGITLLANHIAYQMYKYWKTNSGFGIVVGATDPFGLSEIRKIVGDMTILIPGVGFQQKDVPLEKQVEQVVLAGKNSRGQGMIINSSRGIIFASSGEDFAEAARRETQKLHDLINQYR